MHKRKTKTRLRISAETVRLLGQGRLPEVVGGELKTKSYCVSEADSCSACETARCSNLCDTTTSL